MGKYFKVFIIILILICLVGCNNEAFKEYNGESLDIGVIGEIPSVREDNINFENIEFKDLSNEDTISEYDSIFITKDNLSKASEGEYASIYNKCVVPFFFIESNKGHIPFTDEDLSYEDVLDLSDPPTYAVGIFKGGDKLLYTQYWLYNDIENRKNIESLYSRLFMDISDNKSIGGYDE